ncbi:MAG: acyl carrier protein [Campylobacterales bacterium]|nr:acyl carrier protein [Campylobacterales bacterium]
MKGSKDKKLKENLKQLIIDACEKDVDTQDVGDNDVMFGNESVLGLDSIDALQISIELQKAYNVNLSDSKELRRVFTSINALADYIQPE